MTDPGDNIYALLTELFPICRSITGNGTRESLEIIKKIIPLKTFEVPTGYQAFDWDVPEEWNIKDAYVLDEAGKKIIDFKKNSLHIVGYSIPVDKVISLEELQNHLYSIPDKPDAIPYKTSYYDRKWGFCLAHSERLKLKKGNYKVFIDSELKRGSLTYGEMILPGKSKEEILLTTYICHPSMANNEGSGMSVLAYLAKWLCDQKERKYTYRIVFAPETIGAIVYISKNLEQLKNNVIAGFNVTCVGDDSVFSFMPSRNGDTLADKVALHVLENNTETFKKYSFLERGSDERQYCHPSVDLPYVSIMRSKYNVYPEYHTSLDNLDFVSPAGLYGSYEILKKCLMALEINETYEVAITCEPKMCKRDLHPPEWNLRHVGNFPDAKKYVIDLMNTMVYCDGKLDTVDISNKVKIDVESCYNFMKILVENQLIRKI